MTRLSLPDRTVLAYERVLQRVVIDRAADAVRISMPADAAARRARRCSLLARAWLLPLPALGVALRPLVSAWPRRLLTGVALAILLTCGALAIALAVAWCVGWVAAAWLRPVTVEVAGDVITVTRGGRRPRSVDRAAVREVRVVPLGRLGRFGRPQSATVHLFGRFESAAGELWYGRLADVEAVAALLRTELGLPAAVLPSRS